MSAEHFVCLHGHFYQPPRENPWLEVVEVQDSAAPYHDWNERVTAECYAPNAAARLLDAQGHITALRNNYDRISFNFGPTLLSWMEHAAPTVHAQVVQADQESIRRCGRGNALAQVYGHCIMPLASRRDQQTQVRWGIADFVHRFGRLPDGMWLPETAVDRTSLGVLAENGIRFTILAPSQAARVRSDDADWADVRDGSIDSTRPYRCVLGGGRELTLFFYESEIAHAVAFAGLLNDGCELARRLIAIAKTRPGALAHIATDGESYGHHHRFGEMALAAALEMLGASDEVQLTNYAAYLDHVAVRDSVEVRDNTSWSCVHGIERWRANCGCHSGAHADWQQAWRGPLREALDWLKAELDTLFERDAEPHLHDPWAARDAYIAVLLQPDHEHRESFLARHANGVQHLLSRTRIWKLLEMQRHALLAFTSCGWFFDEPSGIETVQILTYAACAIQLAGDLGARLEPEFLRRLQPLRSNLLTTIDGAGLYRQLVQPQRIDATRMAAHYAIDSLFAPPQDARARDTRSYAFRAHSIDRRAEHAGSTALVVGRMQLFAERIEEKHEFVYAALHLGGHDVHCAVQPAAAMQSYADLSAELLGHFRSAPLTELIRSIDRTFGRVFYTLNDACVAERRRILEQVTARALADCTADYERLVMQNSRLLDFLAQAGVPLPAELRVAATFVAQRRLERAATNCVLGTETAENVIALWSEAQRWKVTADVQNVRRTLETALTCAVNAVGSGECAAGLARAHAVLDLAQRLTLHLNTWEAQNQYYALITSPIAHWSSPLVAELRRLGERLSFHLREWEELADRAA